jgi:hypothetical protein
VKGNPFPLKQNAGKSFQGSIVLGKGFVLTPKEAETLISKGPRNKEVLFPYLNGDDLNNDPEQKPSRWVINFFDWSEEKARSYPDCFEIVERLVKPDRQRWKLDEDGNEITGTYALRKPLPQKWWIYAEKRPALYETISKLDQVMAINRHAKYLLISIGKKNIVYSEATIVLALNSYYYFAILSSSIHEMWAWKNSSTMGSSTLRYSTSNAFETFPFLTLESKQLDELGYKLNILRKELMTNHQIGLTELQNLYHSRNLNSSDSLYHDISKIRSVCSDIDNAVLKVYNWDDIDLKPDFYEIEYLPENDRVRFTVNPIARKEILKRLLLLNHELHNNEVLLNSATQKKNKAHKASKTIDLFPGSENN